VRSSRRGSSRNRETRHFRPRIRQWLCSRIKSEQFLTDVISSIGCTRNAFSDAIWLLCETHYYERDVKYTRDYERDVYRLLGPSIPNWFTILITWDTICRWQKLPLSLVHTQQIQTQKKYPGNSNEICHSGIYRHYDGGSGINILCAFHIVRKDYCNCS